MSSVTVQRVKEVYDARAGIPFDGSTNSQEVSAAVDLLVDHAPMQSARICDVGCGAGWHLKEMVRRGYGCLSGIDLSLSNLMGAGQKCEAVDVFLVQGDVADWRGRGFFDVVTNFNSCLGAFNRQHDRAFLEGVRRILREHGLLLLTYTSREVADRRVGEFSVRYDHRSSTEVLSTVAFDKSIGRLVIEQRINGASLPQECFDVYSEDEMCTLLEASGFDLIRWTGTDDGPLWFVSGVLARKQSL